MSTPAGAQVTLREAGLAPTRVLRIQGLPLLALGPDDAAYGPEIALVPQERMLWTHDDGTMGAWLWQDGSGTWIRLSSLGADGTWVITDGRVGPPSPTDDGPSDGVPRASRLLARSIASMPGASLLRRGVEGTIDEVVVDHLTAVPGDPEALGSEPEPWVHLEGWLETTLRRRAWIVEQLTRIVSYTVVFAVTGAIAWAVDDRGPWFGLGWMVVMEFATTAWMRGQAARVQQGEEASFSGCGPSVALSVAATALVSVLATRWPLAFGVGALDWVISFVTGFAFNIAVAPAASTALGYLPIYPAPPRE